MTIALSLGVLPRNRRRMVDTSVKDSFTMSCFEASRRFAARALAPAAASGADDQNSSVKVRPKNAV